MRYIKIHSHTSEQQDYEAYKGRQEKKHIRRVRAVPGWQEAVEW